MKQIIFFLLLFFSISASSQRIVLNSGNFEFWRFVNNKKDTIIEKYPIQGISFEYQRGKQDITIYYNTGLTQKTIWKGLWKNIWYEDLYNWNFETFMSDFNNYSKSLTDYVSIQNQPIKTTPNEGVQYNVLINGTNNNRNLPTVIVINAISTTNTTDYIIQEFVGGVWRTIWEFQRFNIGFIGCVKSPPLRIQGSLFKVVRSPNYSPLHNLYYYTTNSLNNNKFQFFERSINLNTPSTSNIYNIEGFSKVNIITNITSGSSGTANLIGSYDNNNWFTIAPINFVTGTTAVALSNTDTKNANYLAIRYEDVSPPATPRVLDYICITGAEL